MSDKTTLGAGIKDASWIADAICPPLDPETFHPTEHDRSTATKAIRICGTCPVIAQCLEFALEYGDSGIWGGTSESARKAIKCAGHFEAQEMKAAAISRARLLALNKPKGKRKGSLSTVKQAPPPNKQLPTMARPDLEQLAEQQRAQLDAEVARRLA